MKLVQKIFNILLFYPKRVWLKLRYRNHIRFGLRGHISLKTAFSISNGNGHIVVGRGARIEANTLLQSAGGNLVVGDDVFINRNCMIVSMDDIRIGNGVTIGPGTYIYDHDHNPTERGSFLFKSIEIGDNVWIGAGVIILKGVMIGKNSVIGAGTVVTKNVPPNSIIYQTRESILKQL